MKESNEGTKLSLKGYTPSRETWGKLLVTKVIYNKHHVILTARKIEKNEKMLLLLYDILITYDLA